MLRFDGRKSEDRLRWYAEAAERGMSLLGTFVVAEYRKMTTIFAVQMDEAFEVETIEGLHTGKAGDWLACGAHGELYPIDAEVFAATYEKVG